SSPARCAAVTRACLPNWSSHWLGNLGSLGLAAAFSGIGNGAQLSQASSQTSSAQTSDSSFTCTESCIVVMPKAANSNAGQFRFQTLGTGLAGFGLSRDPTYFSNALASSSGTMSPWNSIAHHGNA